ncbi:MAG: hypothetical protein NVSMB39_7770 [Candidatus Saccharimonadales bacterium]
MPKLAHGRDVYVLGADYEFATRPVADAILTNIPKRLIGVATADCVAVLIFDPVHRAVAAIHSGWRGTYANVVRAALSQMTSEFDTKASDLVAYISPAPERSEYEVGPEVAELFQAKYFDTDKGGGNIGSITSW